MSRKTWTLTTADEPNVSHTLTNEQMMDAMTALVRGGTFTAPVAEAPAPTVEARRPELVGVAA